MVHVRTLFPSRREGGESKGGVIIVKLQYKPKKKPIEITIKTQYQEARTGICAIAMTTTRTITTATIVTTKTATCAIYNL